MPLNAEEKNEQESYSRPTQDQLEIAKLEEELKNARNTIQYLGDYTDKQTEIIDQIMGKARDVSTGKISDAIFKDEVLTIVGWRL